MRRYDDPIEVWPVSDQPDRPDQFRWRGRRYVVRTVLACWVEVGAWWRDRDGDGLPRPVRATDRTVWRVAAQPGRSASSGVYDLVHDLVHIPAHDAAQDPAQDPANDVRIRPAWRLVRVLD